MCLFGTLSATCTAPTPNHESSLSRCWDSFLMARCVGWWPPALGTPPCGGVEAVVSVCAGSACSCSGNQADLRQEEGGLPASAMTFAFIRSWPGDVLDTSRGLRPALSCGPIHWSQKQKKLVPLPLSFYNDGRGGFTQNRSFPLLAMRLSPGVFPSQRRLASSPDSEGAWNGHS